MQNMMKLEESVKPVAVTPAPAPASASTDMNSMKKKYDEVIRSLKNYVIHLIIFILYYTGISSSKIIF